MRWPTGGVISISAAPIFNDSDCEAWGAGCWQPGNRETLAISERRMVKLRKPFIIQSLNDAGAGNRVKKIVALSLPEMKKRKLRQKQKTAQCDLRSREGLSASALKSRPC